jgi:glutaredoxin-related protein
MKENMFRFMQKKELMNESYKYEKFNVYFDFIGSDESKNNFKQFLRAN